ncbi:hypothetical protein NFI96_029824 [Prochilodus magdalenae]|nr:hypothetical protein NFI96_029824 [Prochilodus magdalenae]
MTSLSKHYMMMGVSATDFFATGMELICMALLILFGYAEPRSEPLKLVGPAAPLVVEAGEDLVLPCSILPNTNAVDMRVEWFRLGVKDLFVHLYETGADMHEQQDRNYRGRTELFKEELHKGNASLKLSAVRVSDEGAYKCLIREESWYDDITVNVNVEAAVRQNTWSSEGGVVFIAATPFCCHAILCLELGVEVVQRIWKGGITVTGRWCCPVVSDGLDALPHAPCVTTVSEVALDALTMCVLCLSDGLGQFGPCFP